MTPESTYLSMLARALVEGARVSPAPPAGIRWDVFKQLLLGHNVVTSFAPLIRHAAVPREFIDELEIISRRFRLRGALHLLELSRFLPSLEVAGCRPVVLKGAALCQTLYPYQEMRFFADLDILVEAESRDAACEALERFGYEVVPDERGPEFTYRHHFHSTLRSPQGITVEIHWDLSRPADYFRFDLEGFRRRARDVSMDGIAARIPTDTDQLLHAASQGLYDGFSDLRRILDAALLLRAGAADDPETARRAREQGLDLTLWTLLLVTEAVTGVSAPAGLEERLRPKAAVRACLQALRLPESTLAQRARSRKKLKYLLRWLCIPERRRRRREIRRFLFPGETDLLAMGHGSGRLPGPIGRAFLTVRRSWALLRIESYQLWHLAWRIVSR